MIKVTFYGALAPDDNGEPFTRTFPDIAAWQRASAQLQWTYSKIEVEEIDEPAEMYLCRACGQYHPMTSKEWYCPLDQNKL